MNTILQITILIFVLTKSTKCSKVIDQLSDGQNSIYVSKYCPRQQYCKDGTHVMCMYYDHSQTIGPRCQNYVKTQMTSEMVHTILENVNEIRSRLAMGKETGKDGVILPKAYGMMRIEWDKELATLAQVLANQCLGGREDLCRATDKFPNPSQNIAIIQFNYPNWEYLTRNSTVKGLNEEKLIFAVNKYFRSAYALRKSVTPEIIVDCPPFAELPELNAKYYLNLIRGAATHIGCGTSAYTRYSIEDGIKAIRNSVQIVCNISEGPEISQALYTTYPPISGLGFSKRCGCPKGYKETRGCLCEEEFNPSTSAWTDYPPTTPRRNKTPYYINTEYPTTTPARHNKKIYFVNTVKDARNLTTREEIQLLHQKPKRNKFKKQLFENNDYPKDVKDRVCNDRLGNCEMKVVVLPILSIKDDANSVNQNRMEYPKVMKLNNNSVIPRQGTIEVNTDEELNKEVVRTLTVNNGENGKKLRFIYKKNQPPLKNIIDDQEQEPKTDGDSLSLFEDIPNSKEEPTTEKVYSTAEDDSENNHLYSQKTILRNVDTNADDKNHENKKILTILNILEQEVKKIVLNRDLKEVFDSKMRKIYEAALSKHEEDLSSNEIPSSQENYINDVKSLNDITNDMKDQFRPQTAPRETNRLSEEKIKSVIHLDDKNNKPHDFKYAEQIYKEPIQPRFQYTNKIENNNERKTYNEINPKYDDPNYKKDVSTYRTEQKYEDFLQKYNSDRIDEDDDPSNVGSRDQEALKAYVAKKNKDKALDEEKNYNLDSNDIKELFSTRKDNNKYYDTIVKKDNRGMNDDVATLRRMHKYPDTRAQNNYNTRRNSKVENLRPTRRLQQSLKSRHQSHRQKSYLSEKENYSENYDTQRI